MQIRIWGTPQENEVMLQILRKGLNDKIKVVSSPYLSKNKNERQVQINFLAHACVDTMVDYFRGDINLTFDEFEKVILGILSRMV